MQTNAPRTIRDTIARSFSISNANDAKICAARVEASDYEDEIAAYEDSRSFRETNIAMRSNRAVGF